MRKQVSSEQLQSMPLHMPSLYWQHQDKGQHALAHFIGMLMMTMTTRDSSSSSIKASESTSTAQTSHESSSKLSSTLKSFSSTTSAINSMAVLSTLLLQCLFPQESQACICQLNKTIKPAWFNVLNVSLSVMGPALMPLAMQALQ
ncbi:hypothetical protein ACA910_004618 [Epithemia clementina (nom. ined.)]